MTKSRIQAYPSQTAIHLLSRGRCDLVTWTGTQKSGEIRTEGRSLVRSPTLKRPRGHTDTELWAPKVKRPSDLRIHDAFLTVSTQPRIAPPAPDSNCQDLQACQQCVHISISCHDSDDSCNPRSKPFVQSLDVAVEFVVEAWDSSGIFVPTRGIETFTQLVFSSLLGVQPAAAYWFPILSITSLFQEWVKGPQTVDRSPDPEVETLHSHRAIQKVGFQSSTEPADIRPSEAFQYTEEVG